MWETTTFSRKPVHMKIGGRRDIIGMHLLVISADTYLQNFWTRTTTTRRLSLADCATAIPRRYTSRGDRQTEDHLAVATPDYSIEEDGASTGCMLKKKREYRQHRQVRVRFCASHWHLNGTRVLTRDSSLLDWQTCARAAALCICPLFER